MKKKNLLLTTLAIVPFLAACGDTSNNSKIFLGNKEITTDGNQDKLGFHNVSYESSTNTLTIDSANFKYSKNGVRTYQNIFLGYDVGNLGDVSFLLSYEGTKELNIFIQGDVSFVNDDETTSDHIGGIYILNNVKVNFNGPGKINTTAINHSIIYGKTSNISLDNILIDSYSDICCFGIACNEAIFIDSNMSLSVSTSGYSGLYIPNGTTNTRSKFVADGYCYGLYIGPTYYYDNCYVEITNSTILGGNYYGLVAYDTTFKVNSKSSGISCFDGGKFNNCTGNIEADMYFGVSSLDCTLVFNECNFDVKTDSGIAIQAWRNFFINSTIKAVSLDGVGINSEFNAIVPETSNPGVYITNSDITASGTTCALYSTSDLTLTGSSLTNNQKTLSKHIDKYDKDMTAICEESETELQVASEEESSKVYPTNGAKNVIITKD